MASPQIGHIEQLEGTAIVIHADGTSEPLDVNTQLLADDVITTGEQSHVQVRFIDGSMYAIGAGETVAMAGIMPESLSEMLTIDSGSESAVTQIGLVTSVDGDVIVIRDGQELALRAGDFIYAGDVLKSGPDGSATIRLLDGSSVNLAHNSTADLSNEQLLSGHPELADTLASDPSKTRDDSSVSFLQRSAPLDAPDSPASSTAWRPALPSIYY